MAFSDIDTKVETIEVRQKLTEGRRKNHKIRKNRTKCVKIVFWIEKNASLGSTEDMFLLMDWEKTYSAEKNKKMIDDEKKQPSVTRAINRMCHVRN